MNVFQSIAVLIVLQLALVGCARFDAPEGDNYTVHVRFTDDVTESCGGTKAKACARVRDDKCLVDFDRDTWEFYANHELAHCFGIYTHN